MPIALIDNLTVNSNIPIDSRMVATNSTERDAIEYKYDGMKVFQLDVRTTYTWNQSTYNTSGIIANSWDVGESGIGNVTGHGVVNYIPKWDSTGSGLSNSSIMSIQPNLYEVNGKVGIGGTPSEAFQVNGNYIPSAIGATSAPFVVHKGISTIIGENWYYDISTNTERNFYSYLGSSTITFNKGGIRLKGRTPNSSTLTNTLLDIGTDGSVYFNNYISVTGSTTNPTYGNGSMYFDKNTNRWKVMEESGKSRFISRGYEVYTTLLSQSSTSNPTETLLESTIGNGSWSYVSVGKYNLYIPGAFGTTPQITGFCGPYTSTNIFFGNKISNDVYQITTVSSAGSGTFSGINLDNCLNNTYIEIKVY